MHRQTTQAPILLQIHLMSRRELDYAPGSFGWRTGRGLREVLWILLRTRGTVAEYKDCFVRRN